MEVEGVITDPPSCITLFRRSGNLVGLAIDAEVHDVVTADGTVVDNDVPCPQRYGVPLLDLESLLPILLSLVLILGPGGWCVINVHVVGHE